METRIFSELKTKRLVLRKLKESDAEVIFFLRSDATVNQFIKRAPAQSAAEAVDFINMVNNNFAENKGVNWGIVLDGKLVGTICLWNFSEDKKTAEVGYDLHPDFHGKGIMDEALKKVLSFGFWEMNFEEIEAYTSKFNAASIQLLKKNGFELLPERRDEGNADNWIFLLKKPVAA